MMLVAVTEKAPGNHGAFSFRAMGKHNSADHSIDAQAI